MLNKIILPTAALILCTIMLAGCGYVKMSFKKAHARHWNSLRAQKAGYPEKNYTLRGLIITDHPIDAPLAVVAVSDDIRKNEIVDIFVTNSPSYYKLYLPPASYKILVFADLDGNRRFKSNEVVGWYGSDGFITFKDNGGEYISNLDIYIHPESPSTSEFRFNKGIRGKLSSVGIKGITKSLDDPLFAEKVGKLGLYDPANFMHKVHSMLYTVEGDINKIPVVFVHGIEGTPANFKYMAGRLDKSRFHPWFFYYPSGENLEKSAEALLDTLDDMFTFDQVIIVAHSMGGLVSKAAIDKYASDSQNDFIKMYISLNTPYGGVRSAEATSLNSVNAPSWLDLAPSSEFISRYIERGVFPEHVDFHILFGYGNSGFMKGCSDGTITLESQLEPTTQALTTSVFGFNETHAGMLQSEAVSDKLNSIINSSFPVKAESEQE